MLLLHVQWCKFQILAERSAIPSEFFCCFPQSPQAVAGLVPYTKPQPLHSISFPTFYTPAIVSSDGL
jgi:hypothetical protein